MAKRKKNNSRRQHVLAAILFVFLILSFFNSDVSELKKALLQESGAFQDMLEKASSARKGTGAADTGTGSENSVLQVHFLDIGQGDATLLTCDGEAMLIDAGDNHKGTQIQSYLESKKISSLSYLIGTHPDADHIGGLDVIITKFSAGKLFLPEYEKDTKTYTDVIQAAKYRRLKVTHPKPGETYTLGSAEFVILGPAKTYGSANDNSICLLLTHGENRFLFTGDAEEEAEADMLGADLAADVFKVPHHGSSTASTKAFFKKVSPTYAVISCGDDNSYGHPHAEVLNRLRAAGVKMFRTDDQGTIVISSNGKDLTFNSAPSDNWKAGERRRP